MLLTFEMLLVLPPRVGSCALQPAAVAVWGQSHMGGQIHAA